MEYRLNRRTGDSLSVIGIGSAYLGKAERDEGVRALRAAFEGGINFFDLAAGDGRAFPLWGEALGDVRDRVRYQIHFGADYSKGEYGWTLELETIKRSVDWMLKELGTGTIDYGMIHCQEEMKKAVDCGYWNLFRFNPAAEPGKKFSLDSKEPKGGYQEFLKNEARYSRLTREFPERAEQLFEQNEKNAMERYEHLLKLKAMYAEA